MTEQPGPGADRAVCPWCSAALPEAGAATCPSCGATLVGDVDPALPGVTAIDAEAIVRGARGAVPQGRSRLLTWITGEDGSESDVPAAPGSLAPPPPDVRREMLRMELEAEVADLRAEADAIAAETQDEPTDLDLPAAERSADVGLDRAAADAALAQPAVDAAAAPEEVPGSQPGEGGQPGR